MQEFLERESVRAWAVIVALVSSLFTQGVMAGEITRSAEGNTFTEKFEWQGNHAASILNGTATTVWWDESSWDVRGDSSFTAVETQSDEITNRFHIDIHKTTAIVPTDGSLSDTIFAVGGNGGSGVGVMHLDFQDILSARLRNPLIISNNKPGVIEFYASNFVTTGHWWEIALSPTSEMLSAEYSGVPGQDGTALPGPLFTDEGQLGPGHDNPQDSINLISFGATDVPCITGWWTRFGLTRTVSSETSYFVNRVQELSDLMPSDPAVADQLEHWRMEITPNAISLFVDEDDNEQFQLVETWPIDVPWPEVFVHFMAVAYQADHHPQGDCFQGHIRELKWRDISVAPVKYAKTDVYPKNQGVVAVGRDEGWLGYDLRDIQRFGPPVNGAPQPNVGSFETDHAGKYCNDPGYPCFGTVLQINPNLNLPVPASPAGMSLAGVQVLADHKRSYNITESPVVLSLNGVNVGSFEPASASPAVEQGAWIRRGLHLPVDGLQAGIDSTLSFDLGLGSYLDRIEVEFYFLADDSGSDSIFEDGFETDW